MGFRVGGGGGVGKERRKRREYEGTRGGKRRRNKEEKEKETCGRRHRPRGGALLWRGSRSCRSISMSLRARRASVPSSSRWRLREAAGRRSLRKKELGRVAAGIKTSRRRNLLRRVGRVVKEGRGSGGRGACCDWCFFLPVEAEKKVPNLREMAWNVCKGGSCAGGVPLDGVGHTVGSRHHVNVEVFVCHCSRTARPDRGSNCRERHPPRSGGARIAAKE